MTAQMSWLTRIRVSPPVNRLRYHAYRDVLLAFPRRHECNVCRWRGRQFLTHKHKYVLCPRCGSQIRHRLIAAAFAAHAGVRRDVRIDGASVLHISPEYCLGLLFRPRAKEYIRADNWTGDCDIKIDMTDMRAVADARFDIVVASDVLEHIENDTAAIAEAYRVVRPGGTAILTVPQFDGSEPTLEDPAIATRADRDRIYGQEDHVRNYGADFGARLEAAGFHVTVVEAADFDADYVRRHVLFPPVPLNASYGWDRRRVYFARR
jgi:SAM-dependent methyltransferase